MVETERPRSRRPDWSHGDLLVDPPSDQPAPLPGARERSPADEMTIIMLAPGSTVSLAVGGGIDIYVPFESLTDLIAQAERARCNARDRSSGPA